jgi:UrcA family protein
MFAKTAIASLAAVAAMGFAAASHAAPVMSGSSDPAAMSVSVSIADLNLTSPAGAKAVLARIHTAARTICGDEPDIRMSERFALYQSCLKTTVGRTVASLDAPLVTAINGGEGAVLVASVR